MSVMGLENTSLAPGDIDQDDAQNVIPSLPAATTPKASIQMSRAELFDLDGYTRGTQTAPKSSAAKSVTGISRRQLFDEADFGARQALSIQRAPAAGGGIALSQAGEPDQDPGLKPPGYRGDALIAADHLRELGWSREKIAKILRGPVHHCIHEIAGKECVGSPLPEVSATPLLEVDGSAAGPLPSGVRPKGPPLGASE